MRAVPFLCQVFQWQTGADKFITFFMWLVSLFLGCVTAVIDSTIWDVGCFAAMLFFYFCLFIHSIHSVGVLVHLFHWCSDSLMHWCIRSLLHSFIGLFVGVLVRWLICYSLAAYSATIFTSYLCSNTLCITLCHLTSITRQDACRSLYQDSSLVSDLTTTGW